MNRLNSLNEISQVLEESKKKCHILERRPADNAGQSHSPGKFSMQMTIFITSVANKIKNMYIQLSNYSLQGSILKESTEKIKGHPFCLALSFAG